MKSRTFKDILAGLAFLGPNIAGFALFTLVPLAISLAAAFSNWDLRLHNRFKDEPVRFTFLENFRELFAAEEFWRYLGNTLFLMMGIPFGIAASLGAALLLSREVGRPGRAVTVALAAATVTGAAVVLACAIGFGAGGLVLLLCGLGCGILVAGVAGGMTVYRTLFYLPSFTAGIAVYILWSKMYDAQSGPVNTALRPVLDAVAGLVNAAPAPAVRAGAWVCAALAAAVLVALMRRARLLWIDGEIGTAALIASAAALAAPVVAAGRWLPDPRAAALVAAAAAIAVLLTAAQMMRGRDFNCRAWTGAGSAFLLASVGVIAQLILVGLAVVFSHLPAMATDGLEPPRWLTDPHWAKPALMLMALWAAIGSNSMLLYLAALTNMPGEMLEAADVDGAGRWTRFWNVIWPQLAPTTFFIVVMGCIAGVQGGFEMARAMTNGGPAGATKVLSFYIYTQGFEFGRLGYVSAVAWVMFLIILAVTIVNWKFGSRYVNE